MKNYLIILITLISTVQIFSQSADILLNGTVSSENNQIKNVADPTDPGDAVNKAYFDQIIQSLQSQIDALETQLNNGNAAEIPSEGLVAYYPFNGNADDESQFNNHGTVNGAILTTDRFGNNDRAYSFDGDGDSILSDYIIEPQSTMTFSFWAKTTEETRRMTVMNQDCNGSGLSDSENCHDTFALVLN